MSGLMYDCGFILLNPCAFHRHNHSRCSSVFHYWLDIESLTIDINIVIYCYWQDRLLLSGATTSDYCQ